MKDDSIQESFKPIRNQWKLPDVGRGYTEVEVKRLILNAQMAGIEIDCAFEKIEGRFFYHGGGTMRAYHQ